LKTVFARADVFWATPSEPSRRSSRPALRVELGEEQAEVQRVGKADLAHLATSAALKWPLANRGSL